MKLPYAEPYKAKTIEIMRSSSPAEREKWIREAHFNLFNLQSDKVYIDLLTDSGTGAMSDRQWAAIMTGDESYAGSRSFELLRDTVEELTGFRYLLPTHQGRAAENVLFSTLIKAGDRIPGNAHFDTTKGHIEFRKAAAIDCTIDEASDPTLIHPFKGNVDLVKLRKELENHREKIPFIIITATCNTAGGQPVSINNIQEVSKLAKEFDKPMVIDAARFAENAWFIRDREPAFSGRPIREIILEMFSYFDAMTFSAKKDAIVNIGGLLAMRHADWYERASVFNIMFEGYLTYGGQAGRDLAALAQGLRESTELEYLEARIHQVAWLGNRMKEVGVPLLEPFGGHAIFVDALRALPQVSRDQFPAQTLAIELYKEGGIRSAEIGTLMADRDPVTGKNRYPNLEMVRLAIPRRVYSQNHMDYVAVAAANVMERAGKITSGYKIVREAPILRHFTVALEPA